MSSGEVVAISKHTGLSINELGADRGTRERRAVGAVNGRAAQFGVTRMSAA